MSPHTLILLTSVVAITFNPTHGGVVPQATIEGHRVPQLKFVGTFVPLSPETSKSTTRSLYFISQNAAAWVSAQSDCKAFLGDTATLANIETEEELKAVNEFLANSDNTVSELWLGGKYDVATTSYVWNNDVPVASWAPWDTNEPAISVPVSRIAGGVVGGLKLRAKFNTVSLRYLCELQI